MNDLTRDRQIDQTNSKAVIDFPEIPVDRFSANNEQQMSHSDMFKRNFQTRAKETGRIKPKRTLEMNYKSLMTDHERKELRYTKGKKIKYFG
jgi:hypothetical protein